MSLEEKLKKLQKLEAKTPNPERQKDIQRSALSAFKENKAAQDHKKTQKKSEKTQGLSWWRRLTSITNQFIGELSMKIQKMTKAGVAIASVLLVFGLYKGIFYNEKPISNVVDEVAMTSKGQKKGTSGQSQTQVSNQSSEPSTPAPAEMEVKVDQSTVVAAKPSQTPEYEGKSVKKSYQPRSGSSARGANAYLSDLSKSEIAGSRTYRPSLPQAYPTSNHDKFESFEQNSVKLVQEHPVSTFSIDVDTSSYTVARKSIQQGRLPSQDSVRTEEFINYFDYDYQPAVSQKEPFRPTVAIYPTPWNKHSKIMHIGIKGYEINDEKPAANLVFLIDTSGSMNQQDKLPLLKSSFKLLLSTLSPTDTVSIVAYAGSAGEVLAPTKVKDKTTILAAFDKLRAGGSTAGGQGIELAYQLAGQNYDSEAVNRVILATDGDFNVGLSSPDALEKMIKAKRESGIFLSVLGFGSGNYNDHIMQKLAQNGNGNAAYIDSLSEAQKVLVDEASSTLFPIAKDVKIQVEFNPQKVAEYRLIGYETRHLQREDFNNDKVDAGDIGSGHTVTAMYEIVEVGSKGLSIDPSRYEQNKAKVSQGDQHSQEYAFLKIRYKMPKEQKSKLMTTPITQKDVTDRASNSASFAAAVAGFAQLLQKNDALDDFGYHDVIDMAEKSKGDDRFGYRNEFIQLVRLAQSLDSSK